MPIWQPSLLADLAGASLASPQADVQLAAGRQSQLKVAAQASNAAMLPAQIYPSQQQLLARPACPSQALMFGRTFRRNNRSPLPHPPKPPCW